MYRFMRRVDPDAQAAIAAQLYVEMLEAGYTAIGEFQYLHHAPDGRAFADPATMSTALIEARAESGIGLTLMPVLYLAGDFGGQPLDAGQRRFVHTLDSFETLLNRLKPVAAGDGDVRLGIAPHSLRAVPDEALRQVATFADEIDRGAPIHIHVAEQAREVRGCLEWCDRRPVEHLLDVVEIGPRWCLIHATHTTDDELDAIARSGAAVGLCPTTEANLGDGTFDLGRFLAAGGRFGIGSDSHVSVSPIAELRLLEYGQRLGRLRRLVGASEAEPHTGARLLKAALAGGAQALGRPIGEIAPGARADLVRIDSDQPTLYGRQGDALLDALVFSGNVNPVRDVMVGGRWRVEDGRHHDRERIAARYRKAIDRLA
jgi:formimidoylglutamate deiminase